MESPKICGMRIEFDFTIVLFTCVVSIHRSFYHIMEESGEKASCEKGAEDALHHLHESRQMNDLTRSSSSSSSDNCNYCVNNCSCLETGYVSQIGEKISTCANGKREEVIWAFGINISTAAKPTPRTTSTRREFITIFFRNLIGQKHLFVKSTVSLVLNFFLAISILCTLFLYGNRDSPRILSTLNETQVCIACNGLGLHRSALSAYKQLYNIDRVKTDEGSLLCCYENQRHVYWLLHMVFLRSQYLEGGDNRDPLYRHAALTYLHAVQVPQPVGRQQPCPNPTYNLSFISDLVGEHTEMRVDNNGLHIDDSGMYFVFMTQCLRTEDRCISNPTPNFKMQMQLKSTEKVLIQSDVVRAAGSLVFQPYAYCLFTRLHQRDSLGMNISEHKYLNLMLGSNVFVAFKLHDPSKKG
ncbi:Hypothetical predicted protein [Mytilus galloprovincialis]|uniref:Uncharacterized protein n=3 Tax=Mytilus galloprovincialis TaxID=29158 RepID=A0A8B6D9I2_MYTGA|nr:Hypothetical predicted protein [Mytilus galloprovincialis]